MNLIKKTCQGLLAIQDNLIVIIAVKHDTICNSILLVLSTDLNAGNLETFLCNSLK